MDALQGLVSGFVPGLPGLPGLPDVLGIAAPLAQAAPVNTEVTSGAAEFWVFWLMAPIALAAAISMVLLRNTVHAALMLVLNFFAIAVLYAVLEAQFLAVVQIIVYAGAVMVLFLFVIMLLGVLRDDPFAGSRVAGQRTVAGLLGLVLFGLLTVGVAGPWMGSESACPTAAVPAGAIEGTQGDGRACEGLAAVNAGEDGNVGGVGRLLFTDYIWPFEVTSVLLVIAAIGAMVLGRKHEDPSALTDRGASGLPVPPVPVPDRGGAGAAPSGHTTDPAGRGSAAGATDEGGSR